MIRLYTGEYLISPFVLHFGMNRCSHGCVYCFANLNKPDRETEAADLLRIAGWYERGSTCIEYELLQAGHPVMTANDSDPCAKSNYPTFQALHESSQRHGFRLVYQTRGGVPEAEALIENSPPTLVYVSLTTNREAIARTYEPGNPPHAQRMEFIRRLKACGHMVIVGLNPLIPPWWDDIEAEISKLAEAGVRHIWHQPLHLSRFQIANLSERFKNSETEFIEYSRKRIEPHEHTYRAALDHALACGINIIRMGVSEAPEQGFWDDYFKLGFPFVPTLDAFVRDCRLAAGGKPAMLPFDAFDRWATIHTGTRSVYKEFLVKFGRNIRNLGEKTETAKTMRDVHGFFWRMEDLPTPFRLNAFARVDYLGGYASDDDGVPLMAVSADGFATPSIPADACVYVDKVERHHG